MLEPGHRAPFAVLVDEGEDVLELRAVMQVEELGRAPGVIARQRMGGDVVDLLIADPDDASVVERFEILLAGAQHASPPSRRNSVIRHRRCDTRRSMPGLAYARARR